MEKIVCQTCVSEKTALRCGLCDEATCKSCSQFLDSDAFSFLPEIPAPLSKEVYCHACFESQVRSAKEDYERTMAAAANIDVYFKDQGKETRLIPRSKTIKYVINECADRDELILRFAFRAVLDGFKTLVDVDITPVKMRDGTFQRTIFKGTAVPANAEEKHIIKDKSFRHNPN